MAREFEIRREVEFAAPAEAVFDAVTTGQGGWLWPIEFEPRVGGTSTMGGAVTVWDPPHHFANRAEGPDGWFNSLDFVIERRGETGAVLRYVHSGIFDDNWDTQYDGASRHTDFYLDTLRQYVEHFAGRRAVYLSVDAPARSAGHDAMAILQRGLGIGGPASVGQTIAVPVSEGLSQQAVVDFWGDQFIGLRSVDALYRFFGRDAWGGPLSLSIHAFAESVDEARTSEAWSRWLGSLYP
ncbi:MAG: SRPBCC domain-containing protein [Actinomycetes bacterium]